MRGLSLSLSVSLARRECRAGTKRKDARAFGARSASYATAPAPLAVRADRWNYMTVSANGLPFV